MTVQIEVWPVSADRLGIWLVSGADAWRSDAVLADSEPHFEAELLLAEGGVKDRLSLLHSTSWRTDGPRVVLTYMAVVQPDLEVRSNWPDALPIGSELSEAVGKPPAASPVNPPSPRYIDVLMHGLRHLRFLVDTDSASRDALDAHWRLHLEGLEPALAGMYHND